MSKRIEPVRAGRLDFHGMLYGGTLMRWIETCAAVSARSHIGAAVELLGFDGLMFLRPVLQTRRSMSTSFVFVQFVLLVAGQSSR